MKHPLRIIAGSSRGRWLYSPEGENTRPMLARVKSSLFNIIAPRLEDACVLDMFAGTGALGLEAISRGAKLSVFAEYNKKSFETLEKNIKRLGFEPKSKALKTDAFDITGLLKAMKLSFDIIFISPPYKFFDDNTPEKDRLLGIIDGFIKENILKKEGIVIIEHKITQLKAIELKNLSLMKDRRYGEIVLSFFSVS
jgi:16S rRNA (guanine(966)-N(2))-methyltransferase RsmD